jgi:UDP-glucose 4-epimerase
MEIKLLVTGSSGHLGEAICRTLKAKGQQYVGVDISPSPYTTHVGSIEDRGFVHSLVKDVDYIIHTATLHKPHVGTHSCQEFVRTNITGTLNLLEEAVIHKVKGFIYSSTTSTFGDILTPKAGEPAIWITEESPCKPKNIYGVTKGCAEDLCQLFYRNEGLCCIVLKIARFFPEEDDNEATRESYSSLNAKANEYLYRRVDVADVVDAHLLGVEKVESAGFAKYVISATSPFQQGDLEELNTDAVSVVETLFPQMGAIYRKKGWKMFPRIDRVYVNQRARTELGWNPRYDFGYILDCLEQGVEFRSPLTMEIGSKGYHDMVFEHGPYPVK